MQFFDAEATRAALPFERLIPALQALFASGCEVLARHVHQIAAAGGSADTPANTPSAAGLTFLVMPNFHNTAEIGQAVAAEVLGAPWAATGKMASTGDPR